METIIIVLLACVFAFVIYKVTKKTDVKVKGSGKGSGGGSIPREPWTPDYPEDRPGIPEEFRDADNDRFKEMK